MASMTLTYGATSLSVVASAVLCMWSRLSAIATPAPIPAVQGTSVPFAGRLAAHAAAHAATHAAQTKNVVVRKADDRVPPRGRPL